MSLSCCARRILVVVAGAAILAAGLCGVESAQGRKLNGPLSFSYGGDAFDFALTSVGRVVYDASDASGRGLRGVRLDGTGPTLTLVQAPAFNANFFDLTPVPGGVRVVFRADLDVDNVLELYSVRADGAQPVRKLHPTPSPAEDVQSFLIAPNGERVVYQRLVEESAGSVTILVPRLFSVPVDGSQAPILLTPTLQVGRFLLTSDSARVVFTAAQNGTSLFTVPLAGGASPALVSGNVQEFRVSPDGQRVVYAADPEVDGRVELYSAPADGAAAAVKLNGPLPTQGDVVYGITISPDSTRVVYRADQSADEVFALHVVPITGGATLQLTPNGEGGPLEISPDSATVVYASARPGDARIRLYSVPLDGSHARVELSGSLVAGGNVQLYFVNGDQRPLLEITADSSRVLYVADATRNDAAELYAVPIDGSSAAVRLYDPQASFPTIGNDLQLSAGAERVVFRMSSGEFDASGYPAYDIYSAPVDGSAQAVRLNSPLPLFGELRHSGSVTGFAIDEGSGQVLYRADQLRYQFYELFRAPVDGSTPNAVCSDLRRDAYLDGDVYRYAAAPDGTRAVYHAREASGEDLMAVPLRGPATPRALGAFDGLSLSDRFDFVVSPDSRRVAYRNFNQLPEPYRVLRLHSVPLDASAPHVELSPVPVIGDVEEYVWTPDSERVVYRLTQDSNGVGRLYSAAGDGSSLPVALTPATPVAPRTDAFRLAPDGNSVFFLGFTGAAIGLYEVDAAGLTAPVRLSGPLVAGGNVLDFAVSADGGHLVFRADKDTDEVAELYHVALPGGAVTKLGTTLVAGGDVVSFGLSPDSTRVVYRADQDNNDRFEVFGQPLAGGAVVELSALPFNNRDVNAFQISPDSGRVVFLADQDVQGVFELYSVPITGAQAPLKVSATPVAGGDATESFHIRAGRVVYIADQDANDVFELFSAPLDGSAAPLVLSGPLGANGDVSTPLEFDAADQWVLFRADTSTDGLKELFAAPLDGSRPAQQLNGPAHSPASSVLPGGFVPGEARVLFVSDQDVAGADELYITNALVPQATPPHRRR